MKALIIIEVPEELVGESVQAIAIKCDRGVVVNEGSLEILPIPTSPVMFEIDEEDDDDTEYTA